MSHVAHVRVPFYENLTLEQIIAQLDGHREVFGYLPDGKELRKVPRQWICNIIATIIGVPFVEWVQARINERNAQIVEEKQLAIPMDKDILAAFNASTAVSVSARSDLPARPGLRAG